MYQNIRSLAIINAIILKLLFTIIAELTIDYKIKDLGGVKRNIRKLFFTFCSWI